MAKAKLNIGKRKRRAAYGKRGSGKTVPQDMTVIVLCDRGISSPKLWRQIRAQSPPRT